MPSNFPAQFTRQYDSHLKHLKLKGLQPKTIDAYARAIRRLGGYFDYRIDDLSEAQLTEYFSDLIGTHSWSAVTPLCPGPTRHGNPSVHAHRRPSSGDPGPVRQHTHGAYRCRGAGWFRAWRLCPRIP